MQMNRTTMIILIKLWQDAGTVIIYTLVKLIILPERKLFGPEGHLIEIMSEEDQALAIQVITEAEASFTINEPEYSHWVTGLRDLDDDYIWTWAESRFTIIFQFVNVE